MTRCKSTSDRLSRRDRGRDELSALEVVRQSLGMIPRYRPVAQFSAACKQHNKLVIYTTIGKPREDDPLYPVLRPIRAFSRRPAQPRIEHMVWRGCVKISEQGWWPAARRRTWMRRLLDEKREPLHKLEPGQRKGIQN